jgi:hypothetical protein
MIRNKPPSIFFLRRSVTFMHAAYVTSKTSVDVAKKGKNRRNSLIVGEYVLARSVHRYFIYRL